MFTDCNKVLLVYGLSNLAKMGDDSLDKMDPYQRGSSTMSMLLLCIKFIFFIYLCNIKIYNYIIMYPCLINLYIWIVFYSMGIDDKRRILFFAND